MLGISLRRHLRTTLGILAATTLAVTMSPTTAGAATPKVCAGVSGCKVVVQRDVDGDGRGDQVGIVARNADSGGTVTVRVHTAKGKNRQITNRNVFWYENPWLGSAAIDGRRGAELVVGQWSGAHALQFRVITYRGGELVLLRSPKPFKGHANGISRKNWLIDGSYSFNIGVYRSVSHGKVTLRVKSAERDYNDTRLRPRYNVTISTYAWRSGKWKKQSVREVTRSYDTAARIGGWHVKGLPRFPR